jgi:hypothetical protein
MAVVNLKHETFSWKMGKQVRFVAVEMYLK